ncbi:hypothetical protein M5K25_008812 [Dendrobium thyrsiflorum]|uniref:Uncharacterized protein n=1 Tax=Dendrobium thyrsiflorum TaxID=117978 RepID=A0ABD0VGS2_DENTH
MIRQRIFRQARLDMCKSSVDYHIMISIKAWSLRGMTESSRCANNDEDRSLEALWATHASMCQQFADFFLEFR